MRIPSVLHGIVVIKSKSSSLGYTGAIQVLIGDNPSPFTVFEDEYSDPVIAMQDLTRQYVEMQNG